MQVFQKFAPASVVHIYRASDAHQIIFDQGQSDVGRVCILVHLIIEAAFSVDFVGVSFFLDQFIIVLRICGRILITVTLDE